MTISFPERFNMADYFLYHNLEEGREHRVCLYFEDQEWTYGQTAAMSNRVGNVLRDLGMEIEHRVELVWSGAHWRRYYHGQPAVAS